MRKSNYLQANAEAFAAQMRTFKTGITHYKVTLGLTDGQITAQAADCDYFNYVLACMSIMANAAQQWTAWKDLIRDGGTSPAAPVLPAAVPAVARASRCASGRW